ncbi:hypothetical protein L1987_10363 [Smallanthus sonchifolius]|uniref:Uncharacterized protein n=1 Tax=Smallanthus sonchifolius TaxID=185202 RepID=A0ACB9JRV7_9ASTR|nr:hypothetical protein L1987_10363 [Smallanthus sonchifolius]
MRFWLGTVVVELTISVETIKVGDDVVLDTGIDRESIKRSRGGVGYLSNSYKSFIGVYSLGVGINYGQIANNLPSPSRVSILLGSLNISKVKLYDADPNVLTAFANTNVEFIIGLGNEYLQKMQDPQQAQMWIQLKSVTTAYSLQILKTSFPPSNGAFRDDLVQYIQPILSFHSMSTSPFLINAYPYFAYKSDPENVRIEYLLFEPNSGTVDPNTNLKYDNMLYSQIDAVYYSIKALGHTNIQVRISETGWPSKGDVDEPGATVEYAGIYKRNLLQRMQAGQGTPAHPSQQIDIYVFALFNENMKPGPTSERNYGLYYPDGTPVYNLGVQGYLPRIDYSSSGQNELCVFRVLVLLLGSLLIA